MPILSGNPTEDEIVQLQEAFNAAKFDMPSREEVFGSSFENLNPVAPLPIGEKRRLILRGFRVDSLNLKRRRLVLVPSMCTKPGCNHDAATANKYPSWDHVPDSIRPAILRSLDEHIHKIHTNAEDLIIDEDQLPKRWLGAGMSF